MTSFRLFRGTDARTRLLLSVAGGHFITLFGVRQRFRELLLMPRYYLALISSCLIAWVLVSYISFLSARLDARCDWLKKTGLRILLQLTLGIGAAGLLAFLLATLYFFMRGVNIFNTLYLRIDFPVILLLLLFANLYYLILYLWRSIYAHRTEWLQRHNAPKLASPAQPPASSYFLVDFGKGKRSVAMEQIAFFVLESECRYLVTHDNHRFLVDESLEEIMQLVDYRFFRANRQLILSRQAAVAYKVCGFGKLEVVTMPSSIVPATISQKRARAFKAWWISGARPVAPRST